MGFYGEHVLPRLVEWTCGSSGFERWRREATDGLSGRVVEVGFGSGLNVGLYPPEVTQVLAVEPAALARQRAATRIAATASTAPVEFVGLDGQELPLGDGSCDGALFTFTLCTVPDPDRALAEVYRVLVPGGTVHFLEHGLSPDPGVARWQHRMEPVQRTLAGGCHLTRDAPSLVSDAGFSVTRVEQRYVSGPKPWCYMSVGAAAKPVA